MQAVATTAKVTTVHLIVAGPLDPDLVEEMNDSSVVLPPLTREFAANAALPVLADGCTILATTSLACPTVIVTGTKVTSCGGRITPLSPEARPSRPCAFARDAEIPAAPRIVMSLVILVELIFVVYTAMW
jgi:hypothetical protein